MVYVHSIQSQEMELIGSPLTHARFNRRSVCLKGSLLGVRCFPGFRGSSWGKPIRNRDQIGRLFWIYIGSLMRSLWDLGIFNWRSVHRIWSHLVISQGTREAMGLSCPRRHRCRAMGDERSDDWEIAMAV